MTDRDAEALRRRLEVVRLPVVRLRQAGFLSASRTDAQWERTPRAVGVGPDQLALAVWNSRDDAGRRLVSLHDGGRAPVRTVVLEGCLEPTFVQPLPEGRILLVRARRRPSEANAEVWDFDGRRHFSGDLGDAIEDVLTTADGAIWVGYFDEAMSGSGPQTHGLARFTGDLRPSWLYPAGQAPAIFDCYALNVAGETAWTCAYTEFHLVSADGEGVRDFGEAPQRGAPRLLVDGGSGALIGGYGPEYDLVSRFRITEDGLVPHGPPLRLVLPDGMEVIRARSTCRGADLHVFIDTQWFRTDLDVLRVTTS